MTKKASTVDWTAFHSIQLLLDHLKSTPGLQFLEIGSFEGLSTCFLLDNWQCTVTAIDPCDYYPIPGNPLINPSMEAIFRSNIAEYGERVRFFKARSGDILPTLECEFFDFIYVDGDHRRDTVFDDAVKSFPLLRPGGVMLFDDYMWNIKDPPNSPFEAVNAFLTQYADKLERIHHDWFQLETYIRQVAIRKV